MKKHINPFVILFCVLFVCFVFWISFVLLGFFWAKLMHMFTVCDDNCPRDSNNVMRQSLLSRETSAFREGGICYIYISKKKVNTYLIRPNSIFFVGDEDTFKSTERLGLHQTSCKI